MTTDAISKLRARWRDVDLASQFAMTAAAVIAIAMAILASWMTGRIEHGVVAHAATSAALHMDVFIEPHLQELATQQSMSDASKKALNNLRAFTKNGQSVVAVSIWDRHANLIYSTDASASAKASGAHAQLIKKSWTGEVQSAFEPMFEPSGRASRQSSERMLKVFAPMHVSTSNELLAVAELDAASPALAQDLRSARLETTGLVGFLSLAMAASLFGIVRRGSRLIDDQRRSLEDRVSELTALLSENAQLQSRIVQINHRATENNDKALRRVGAELHDGAVQLIALSLLRLETLRLPGLEAVERRNYSDLDAIENALRDALQEIRSLCSGLALPNLEKASVARVIDYAIMNHERRSKTEVQREISESLPPTAPPLVLMCIYRFIQEGLTNAVRHADGHGQAVAIAYDGQRLQVTVSDDGPGMTAGDLDPGRFASGHGLGLAGLKDRVETIGGRFTISSAEGEGTKLTADIDMGTMMPTTPGSDIVLQ